MIMPDKTKREARDCGKILMIEADHFKNLTWIGPNKSQE